MADTRFASVRRSVVLGALSALGLVLGIPASAHAATLVGDAATAFDSKVLIDGLDQPTDLAVLPDGRVIIVQKSGDVVTVVPNAADPVTDHINVSTDSEQGLLGIILDPNFATNQYLYVYASSGPDANNRHQILRYKFGADSKLGTKTVVVDMGLKGPANHDGGGIDIYKGNLYIGVGDTGANASPPTNHYGSCLNQANGKILRVSLADATLGQPVADNPLMNQAMVTGCDGTNDAAGFVMKPPEKRIWAWGFRNPFRIWMDKTTGKLWVGDVGESTREEIDVAVMGKHHGYPFREGMKDWAQAFAPQGECMGETPASECIAPVYDYDHGTGQCIIGGRILDGCGWPAAWKSRYIFGDHEAKKIWTIDVNATRDGVVANSVKDFASSNHVSGLRMGTDNALYILEESPGVITRVTAKGSMTTANSCPSVNAEPGSNPGGGAGSGGASAGGAAAGGSAAGGSSAGGNASGGANAAGGNSSSSGGASNSAGTSNTGTGPTAGTTGTNPGAGGSSAAGSGDSGGCGCHVAGAPVAATLGWGALLGALGMMFRRRNRQSR